jgi:hypothetical protein
MELGSQVNDVRRLGQRFDSASQSLSSHGRQLNRSAVMLSARFAAERNLASSIASRAAQHSVRLQQQAGVAVRQAGEQERVSGDRIQFSGAGLAAFGAFAGSSGTFGPASRGNRIGSLLGSQARRITSSASRHVTSANQKRAEWTHGTFDAGKTFLRSYKFPHAPRKLSTFARTNVLDIKRKFTPTTRVAGKALRGEAAFGIAGVVGGFFAGRLEKHGVNDFYRNFGAGSGKLLEALLPIRSAQGIFKATKSGLTSVSKLKALVHPLKPLSGGAAVAAKIGGGFAILGGAIGIFEAASKYKSGEWDGNKAAFKGATNAATLVGGVLMFTPAAPLGAAIVAGAAIVQAGAWAIENRTQIASFATATAKKAFSSAPVQAALKQVAFVAPPAKQVAKAAVQLTKSVSKLIPKWGRK